MFSKTFIALSALTLSPLISCSATPLSRDKTTYPDFVHPANGECTDYIVNSTVTYEQLQWNQQKYTNNYEVATLLTKIAIQGKVPLSAFAGSRNVTHTFQIGGTFCRPKVQGSTKQNTVLVATHGAGFDRRYWASSHSPEEYNFAQYALDAGYSVFYYDRLGVGYSSRVSGYEIEINPQVEVLADILKSLRHGKYTDNIRPSNLVLVGHSFGSAISNYILGRHPELVEGAVLTGFAFPTEEDPASGTSGFGLSVFASRIVSTLPEGAKPQFSGSFDDGWLSFRDAYAFTESFLGAGDYEIPAAEYAYRITQPYSGIDFLSAFAQPTVADRFAGKVLLAPAERDLFFCAGDCKDTFGRGGWKAAFPNPNTNVTMYFQEGAGHGQNFAKNAKDMYETVIQFADTF